MKILAPFNCNDDKCIHFIFPSFSSSCSSSCFPISSLSLSLLHRPPLVPLILVVLVLFLVFEGKDDHYSIPFEHLERNSLWIAEYPKNDKNAHDCLNLLM